MRKIQMIALAAIAAFGAFAEEEDGHTVLYYGGSGGNWSGKYWKKATTDTALIEWENDAIGVVSSGNINFPKKNITVYKIRWDSNNKFQAGNDYRLSLGAGGIEVNKSMNVTSWSSTKSFHLSASQTWTNISTTARSINMNYNDPVPTKKAIALTADDDVKLTLAGSLTWNFTVRTVFTNADVQVNAPAKLAVTYYAVQETIFNARNLILDGSASTLTSSAGDPCLMAKTLRLRNGGKLTVNSGLSVGVPLDGVADTIVADEGTGTLAGVVAAKSDGSAYDVEVAAGATLVLGCTWKGAPRIRVHGAGTILVSSVGIPEIERGEDFTGEIKYSGFTVLATYPEMVDVNLYPLDVGATATLRYFTPRAPVVYTNGLSVLTGITEESQTNGWSFTYYNSERNAAYPAQGVFRTLEDGIVKVRPLDPPRQLTSSTTKSYVTWENSVWADAATGTTGTWADGSVATLSAKNTSIASYVTIGGLRWSSFASYFSATGYDVHLGKWGISINKTSTSATGFRAWNMHEFRLVAPQDWECTTTYNAYVYMGDFNDGYPERYPTLFTADADANMTLKGPIYLCLNCPGDFHESDVSLEGSASASGTLLYIDYSRWGDRDVMLNARKLTIGGRSTVYMRTGAIVEGGYAIAAKVALYPHDGYVPLLSFDKTTAAGAYPVLDAGAIETTGEGVGTISGTARLPAFNIPVAIAEGTTLNVAVAFSGSASRAGALVLSGTGSWLATSTSNNAYTFDNASVAGFEGDVVVTNGAVLNLSGSVDFPSLILRDGAKVRFKLDRGDKIADMSKVTFPESGSVTFELYRDDAIAQGEGSLDSGMDFSAVSAADLAKLSITVEDREGVSPYSVTATPRVDGNGRLFADLSSSMSKKNGTFGGMIWAGTDWGDATDPQNWVIYPSGTTAANYNPDNHPADTADAQSRMSSLSIYCAANWRLDLGGLTWSSPDSRNNDAADGAFVYGVSNGTWNASTMIIQKGTVIVENGATFTANGFKSGEDNWNLGSGATKASPFLFNVRSGGKAAIGHRTLTINSGLYNVRYQVDAGGSLAYYLKPTFSNKACTTFANEGDLSFPYGLALVNESQATTGELAIVQSAGTLRFAGAFSLTRGEGCGSKAGVTFAGGTTVISNDTTFAGWDFAVADGADFAIEIPKSGDFSTEAFRWGEGVTFEKKGDGVARFALTGEVASVGLRLSGGALQPTGTNDAGRVDVVFAGGAVGVSPTAAGNAAEYGLLVTNGTVSGACSVRDLGGCARSGDAFPFLTVAAEADPAYVSGDVLFVDRKGRPTGGDLLREEIMVGETQCVRYSATFVPRGLMLLVK